LGAGAAAVTVWACAIPAAATVITTPSTAAVTFFIHPPLKFIESFLDDAPRRAPVMSLV
jgi:hypothetical protein